MAIQVAAPNGYAATSRVTSSTISRADAPYRPHGGVGLLASRKCSSPGAFNTSGAASLLVLLGLKVNSEVCRRRHLTPQQTLSLRSKSRQAHASIALQALGRSQQLDRESLSEPNGAEKMVLEFGPEAEERLSKIRDLTRTPVTLLSGFLGAGKTTLLKHLLENQEGVRVGVVVNDVASVNIDAQLIQRYEREGSIEMAELSNGCVCCTAADDLIATVQELINQTGQKPLHHVIIELSGVSEPEVLKSHWDIGVEVGMPATLLTEIARTVAVVDASLFGKDWLDSRDAMDRNEEHARHVGLETVGQLLADQVEKADVVVLNKIDLATPEELEATEEVVRALNRTCEVRQGSFCKVDPLTILPPIPDALRYPQLGSGANYRWAQSAHAVEIEVQMPAWVRAKDISFSVGRTWVEVAVNGEDVPRLQGRLFGRLRCLDEWLWELEGEGDTRHLRMVLEKSVAGLWEDLWAKPPARVVQQPSPDQDVTSMLDNMRFRPSTTRPSRSGRGGGWHNRFGIETFVYEKRRPFSSVRLGPLLHAWGDVLDSNSQEALSLEPCEPASGRDVARLANEQSAAEAPVLTIEQEGLPDSLPGSCFKPVLRSKGFCWIDSEPLKRHEWAQAGRSLTVSADTWWWSVLQQDQLDFQLSYPGAKREYERVSSQSWHEEWGDRRQEIVFIGGPNMCESSIRALLDKCLLTDDELAAYNDCEAKLSPPAEFFGIEGLMQQMDGMDPRR